MNDQQQATERVAFRKWAEEHLTGYSSLVEKVWAAAWQAAIAQREAGMDKFFANLARSRTKYPNNARMFDGILGEIDELRRAYVGDGDIHAEALDVAVCAFRIAAEGDSGGNRMLKPVAEGEVASNAALLRTSSSFKDSRYLRGIADLLERTEAARLAAKERAKHAEKAADLVYSDLLQYQKSAGEAYDAAVTQLTAERARSEKLAEGIFSYQLAIHPKLSPMLLRPTNPARRTANEGAMGSS